MIALLSDVRRELNGTSEKDPGAGIVDDLQDLIGESVWDPDNSSVITYYEFRERLLNVTGWEQFTDLFRFFAHFHWKMDYEVKKTTAAFIPLCAALKNLVEPREKSSARFSSLIPPHTSLFLGRVFGSHTSRRLEHRRAQQ